MNVRIFWVRAMKCMCAQTRPRFILSSEGVVCLFQCLRSGHVYRLWCSQALFFHYSLVQTENIVFRIALIWWSVPMIHRYSSQLVKWLTDSVFCRQTSNRCPIVYVNLTEHWQRSWLVCWLLNIPNHMLVYLRVGSAQKIVCAASQR